MTFSTPVFRPARECASEAQMLFRYLDAVTNVPMSAYRSFRLTAARTITLAIAVAVAAIVPSKSEAHESVNLTIYGVGASRCEDWLSGRQMLAVTGAPTSLAWQQMGWVLGYLTAFSQQALPSGAIAPGGAAVAAELDTYCAEYPEELLAIATFRVATQAVERQLQTAHRK